MDISYVLNKSTSEYEQHAHLAVQPLRGHAANKLQTVGRLSAVSTTRTALKVPIAKINFESKCWYPIKQKEQKERELKILKDRVYEYEQLLRDIIPKVDVEYANKIMAVLSKGSAWASS
ncbi:hypothetical protein HCH54_005205 [Aspergillus fumigatus]